MKKIIFALALLPFYLNLFAQEAIPCEDITRIKFVWVHQETEEPYSGICESYSSSGNLIQRGQFREGKREGEWKSWYADGTLRSIEKFENDLQIGVKKTWHNNGALESEDHYKEGLRQGTYKAWYEDGQLKYKFSFDKGLQTGQYLYYHPNGQKWEEGYFEAGENTGTWNTWDENGKLIIISVFENGEMVSEKRLD